MKSKELETLYRSLMLTSMVCERGAALEQYKHILFEGNKLHAFNGLVVLEAPSELGVTESFAVHYDRLAAALRALKYDDLAVSVNSEFLIFKRSKLTVRVRRIPMGSAFQAQPIENVPKKDRINGVGLKAALARVAPFISSDASRPWSTAALLRGGYLWATNNLALVRTPLAMPKGIEMHFPGPAVGLLMELDSIDWYARREGRVILGSKEALLAFPNSSAEWPDAEPFFKGRPKRIPQADPELLEAAKMVEKFSDRFVTLNDSSIEGKVATIESEYELSIRNGKGVYNAALFSLIAEHATHIDFSPYPKPIHFTAEQMEGVMVGVAPPQGAAK